MSTAQQRSSWDDWWSLSVILGAIAIVTGGGWALAIAADNVMFDDPGAGSTLVAPLLLAIGGLVLVGLGAILYRSRRSSR